MIIGNLCPKRQRKKKIKKREREKKGRRKLTGNRKIPLLEVV